MENNILNILQQSLKEYDNKNNYYSEYINKKKLLININSKPIFEHIKTGNQEEIFGVEKLGIYYYDEKLFCWGWLFPTNDTNNITIYKTLINYALSISSITSNNLYLRSLILNSRIKINNNIELEFLLASIQYILQRSIDFIYPDKVYDKNGKLLYIIYCAIKISKD